MVGAFIANAWWRDQQDTDGDGCWTGTNNGSARLNWDADVTGAVSLTVFEKIYYRLCTEGALVLANTTAAHVITGQSSADAQYIDVPMHPNCACYDYRIEVYRAGQPIADDARDRTNDADLGDHREEAEEQTEGRAVIADAGWGDQQDLDMDGCVAGTMGDMAGLYWEPDVLGSGSLSVFEKLYRKDCSGTWLLWVQTDPHVITGSGGNTQFRAVPMHSGCACYDYRIEIYRVGQSIQDDVRDWTNDPDLDDHLEELLTQDRAEQTLCDFDSNGRIDLADYAALRRCLADPNRMPHPDPPITVSECLGSFDADADGDVDLREVAFFQTRFQGEGASSNLLRNPSFEDVPGQLTGPGILPSDWVVIVGSPAT